MADIVNLEPHFIGSPTPGVNLYQLPNASMQVLQDLINATWNEGKTAKDEFSAKMTAALAGFLDITSSPHVSTSTVTVPTITEPVVDIPTTIDTDGIYDQWETRYLELAAWLDGKFTTFRATYFPDESNTYTAAEDYLQAAIANTTVGMPAAIASQIVGDAHARITVDKARAQDAVIAQFASRGFPLPPGAAASAVLQIEQKAMDEIAGASRQIAITSIDLQKFNVEAIMKLRDTAMRDAVEYIKALASGPDMAAKMSNIGYDAQTKLISSVSSLYGARANAAEVISKVAQYNNSVALEAAAKNQMADLDMIKNKLSAMMAEAAEIAKVASSLLNNLNVSATLHANGGTQVSQSNEF